MSSYEISGYCVLQILCTSICPAEDTKSHFRDHAPRLQEDTHLPEVEPYRLAEDGCGEFHGNYHNPYALK